MRRSVVVLILVLLIAGCKKKVDFQQAQPSHNPVADLKQGDQLLSQRRCAEAAGVYEKFLQKYPKDAGAWNSIGLAYLCIFKTDLAINAFKQALVYSPTYTDVHNNLGIAYMQSKNYAEAKIEFTKALEDRLFPKSAPVFNLAKLAFLQGNYEESRALAKKVMKELAPKEAGPVLLYSLSLEYLGRKEEALVAYRDLLKMAPDNLEGNYHLATLLLEKNQLCEARLYYTKVIDIDPLGDLGQKSISALKTVQCPH